MAVFAWTKENEVFLPQTDGEHRELFRLSQQLHDAFAAAEYADVKAHFSSLSLHFEAHFASEESMMKSTRYPLYGWHRAQHDTMRRRLKLFCPQVEAGDISAADLFWEFLGGWLKDHTGVTDRMFGAFIRNYERAHGLTVAAESLEPEGAPVG